MTGNRWLYILLPFLVAGWCGILVELLEERHRWLVLAFLATVLLATWLIRHLLISLPRKQLQEISLLAKSIETLISDKPVLLEEGTAPDEIRPIVRSVNRLVRYQQERYEHERDFTAYASHELRTPLAGIRLQAEVGLLAASDEQKNHALRKVLKSTDRGTRLAEQLLTVSRLTAMNAALDMETVDLDAIAQAVAAEYMEQATAGGMTLVVRGSKITARGNADALSILLDNLLRNAVNYCGQGAEITVATGNDGGASTLSVTDTGPGIPAEKRALMLQPFQRATKGNRGGTGLGLSIVKRIADLHGGTLNLGEGAGGRGLKVELRLP